MEEMYEKCCGLDVHRDSITACVMSGYGTRKRKEIKEFSTFTRDIKELASWLKSKGVFHVAVESTGIYWKPIFNVFEGEFDVCLVNARHVKNVPGRKTDVKDSEWLCRLLKSGLLSRSFIPPKDIVRLRELVRYRTNLTRDKSRAKNRVIKVLENANIKLSSVFSDVFGLTAWGIIKKISRGVTHMGDLMSFIDPRVRATREDIEKSLEGTLDDDDRTMLRLMIEHVEFLEKQISKIEERINAHIEPYSQQAENLMTIPGVKKIAAASIIAEVGVDMSQFRSASHLSAWSGMCPGNNQSAGKVLSSRLRKGNTHLKTVLTQVGWAISRTKKTYLGAKYRALAARRGKKRAIMGIGRKTLEICYHILEKGVQFMELGVDFLDKLEPVRKVKYHKKRLEELGYEVIVKEKMA